MFVVNKKCITFALEITKLIDSERLCKIAHSSFTVFIFTLPNKQSGYSSGLSYTKPAAGLRTLPLCEF